MGLKRAVITGILILMGFVAGRALADSPSGWCPLPLGARSVFMEDAPIALRKMFADYAPPGTNFDIGDVVVTGKREGILFIWSRGNRWVVVGARGGRVTTHFIFAYRVSADGSSATPIPGKLGVASGTLCSAAERMLGTKP